MLFGGNDPAAVLHALLGTGWATQFFSGAYMLFFLFIPGTLAFALVFTPNLQAGLFYATALSLNWLLGAGELLPAAVARAGVRRAGPVLAACRRRASTQLQSFLSSSGSTSSPTRAPVAAQSIGAFASLHVSIFFTGALAAHLLGLGRTAADRRVAPARR